jgi:uncharacterized protein YlzI (FlbEa/FlbD family)
MAIIRLSSNIAIILIALNSPDGRTIWVNPEDIISIRAVHEKKLYAPEIRCVLQTVDGKTVAVTDTCNEVRQKLGNIGG